jgi:hypothetical protein
MHNKSTMTTAEQKQKVLRARVALALYTESGKVPTEQEVEHTYHLTRVLYKAVLGTHFMRKTQKHTGQLVLL